MKGRSKRKCEIIESWEDNGGLVVVVRRDVWWSLFGRHSIRCHARQSSDPPSFSFLSFFVISVLFSSFRRARCRERLRQKAQEPCYWAASLVHRALRRLLRR